MGMDEDAEGTFLLPIALIEVPAKVLQGQTTKSLDSERKTAIWRDFVAKTEGEEKMFVRELKQLWGEQKKEVIKNLRKAETPDEALFDEAAANTLFDEAMLPILTNVFENHFGDAQDLLRPENPHQDSKQLNELALIWLRTRSLKLAKQVVGTDFAALRLTLVEGFEAGESIPKLTKRVTLYYAEAEQWRAPLVARTETIAASVEGNLQGYEELGIKKVEWYTAIDGRVCNICGPHHDEEFNLRDTHGMIPAHPQCRCVFIPVT